MKTLKSSILLLLISTSFILSCKKKRVEPTLNLGLVLHLPFNLAEKDVNGTPIARDISGNDHHGIIHGGPTLVTGRKGGSDKAFQFSSEKFLSTRKQEDLTYIEVNGASPKLSGFTDMTISVWINQSRPSAFGPPDYYHSAIVTKFYQLILNGGSVAQDTYGVSTAGTSNTVTTVNAYTNRYNNPTATDNTFLLNQWHHIVFVHDGKVGGKLYVDGRFEKAFGASGNIVSSTNPVLIGVCNNQGLRFRPFDGLIDEVRIYNRALSANEVDQLYKL